MADNRPDLSGLDHGPPLPRSIVNGWKKDKAIALYCEGKTLRGIAAEIGVSHETVRVWTTGHKRSRGEVR